MEVCKQSHCSFQAVTCSSACRHEKRTDMNGFKTQTGVFLLDYTEGAYMMNGQSQQQIQIYFILTKFLTKGTHCITVQNLNCNAQAVLSCPCLLELFMELKNRKTLARLKTRTCKKAHC